MAEATANDADRARLLLQGQDRALQLAREGAPLEQVLEVLVRAAESQSDGRFLGSILLLGEGGKHLRHGAAPSLPDAWNAAVDGLRVGPAMGSCGTAAHFGHAIVVTDIARDPLWIDFRELALSHGLHACWSTPFLARDGSVLGTLALYYREPRGPSERDRETVRIIGNTASMVLENAQSRSKLRNFDQRAQVAARAGGIGYFAWEVDTDTVTWQNARPYEIFGIPPTEPAINARRFAQEFLHPDDREAFSRVVREAIEGGAAFQFEGRIRRVSTGELRWVKISGQVDRGDGTRSARIVGTTEDVTAHHSPTERT